MRSVNVFWFRFSVFGFWFLVFGFREKRGRGERERDELQGSALPPPKKKLLPR